MIIEAIRDCEVLDDCSAGCALLIRDEWKRRALGESYQDSLFVEIMRRCHVPRGEVEGDPRQELREKRVKVMQELEHCLHGEWEEWMDFVGYLRFA